jgi:Tfp pilus assembly protein PilN
MRAVNLIPRDTRRPGVAGISFSPSYAILAVLTIVLVLVTVVVLTNNTISDRQAKLASLRSQLAVEQVRVGQLAPYQRFAQLAQARIATVRQIVGTRFDWHGALADLSKVVPANTSLQTLNASVSPGTGGGSSIRGDIPAPAFDLTGCTRTQDDVARLMSRLRIMSGVTRVTLQSSTAVAAASGATVTPSTTAAPGTCGNGPSFHVVVFFSALPTATGAATSTTGVVK